MPSYARTIKRQPCLCRLCYHPLYSRTEIPEGTSAMCTECAIANRDEAGVVFNRTLTRMVLA